MTFFCYVSTSSIVRSTPDDVDNFRDSKLCLDLRKAFANILPLMDDFKIGSKSTSIQMDETNLLPEQAPDLTSFARLCHHPLKETLALMEDARSEKSIRQMLDTADYIGQHHPRGIDIVIRWHSQTHSYDLHVDTLKVQQARDALKSYTPPNIYHIHNETITRVTKEGLVITDSGQEFVVTDSSVLAELEELLGKKVDLTLDANRQTVRIRRPALREIVLAKKPPKK